MRKLFWVVLATGFVVAACPQLAGAGATAEGCCQYKPPPLFGFLGLPPVTFCAETASDDCPDSEGDPQGVDHVFTPNKVCGSLGQCVDPGARIETTTTIAPTPQDCGTDAAQQIFLAKPDQALINCHQICNETPITLTTFTLIVNGVPEFEDLQGVLPPGACSTARQDFNAPHVAGASARVAAWLASDAANPELTGGGAEIAPTDVFTDTQQAFVIIVSHSTTPAVGSLGIGVIGAALLGLGMWRLMRRSKAQS